MVIGLKGVGGAKGTHLYNMTTGATTTQSQEEGEWGKRKGKIRDREIERKRKRKRRIESKLKRREILRRPEWKTNTMADRILTRGTTYSICVSACGSLSIKTTV